MGKGLFYIKTFYGMGGGDKYATSVCPAYLEDEKQGKRRAFPGCENGNFFFQIAFFSNKRGEQPSTVSCAVCGACGPRAGGGSSLNHRPPQEGAGGGGPGAAAVRAGVGL